MFDLWVLGLGHTDWGEGRSQLEVRLPGVNTLHLVHHLHQCLTRRNTWQPVLGHPQNRKKTSQPSRQRSVSETFGSNGIISIWYETLTFRFKFMETKFTVAARLTGFSNGTNVKYWKRRQFETITYLPSPYKETKDLFPFSLILFNLSAFSTFCLFYFSTFCLCFWGPVHAMKINAGAENIVSYPRTEFRADL